MGTGERTSRGKLWAVVLAGGRGRRLAALTRALYGVDRPKQFAALDGDKTLLQQTVDRIAPLVPSSRVVVTVAADQRDLAREQLAAYEGVKVLADPLPEGTAEGVLLAIAYILARDPEALVVVLPSDHHFRRPAALLAAIEQALGLSRADPDTLCLVAAPPERAAEDLGWIVPGRARAGGGAGALPRSDVVRRFVEKPSAEGARELLEAGALLNTMVMVGKAAAIWRRARQTLPGVTEALSLAPGGGGRLGFAEGAAGHDLSRDLLQQRGDLSVVRLKDAGWSDCGTPDRLFEALRGTPAYEQLVRRLGARARPRAPQA